MPSHGHSASVSTNGAHHHGVMGEKSTEYKNPVYGFYDSSNSHFGLEDIGTGDWDNALWSTSTDGAHSHTVTIGATGGNGGHENRQPYTVVNFWRRTA